MPAEENDPVLGQFLGFLSRDMASHPERLQALDAAFVQHLQALTDGVALNLDAPLSSGYPPDDWGQLLAPARA